MKKIFYCKKKISIVLFFLLSLTYLSAETFRVGKVKTINLSDNLSTEHSTTVGINEAFAIFLPEDKTFIQGLEIKMEIPSAVASWPDCVACSVYNNISPKPSENKIDYSGTRFYVSTLPSRLSWILQIPLANTNTIKSNNYTTKTEVIKDIENNAIFIRFQPVMKGVPAETLQSSIKISVKPILIDKGYLNLSLSSKEKIQPCTLYIDDSVVNLDENKKILLSTGVHDVTLISEYYRTEVRTVRVDQAKTTDLIIELKSVEPTLLILAPEGTEVFLDEVECKTIGTEFAITEGEHKIRFSVGNYEIIRTINVTKGKTYTANFSLDLDISEE
jgi:hypothetical protein